MTKLLLVMTLAAAMGCDSGSNGVGGGSGAASKLGSLKDKIEGAGNKVGGALDKLDKGEAEDKLASAKASIASGGVAADECDWASRQAPDPTNANAAALTDLKRFCAVDAPMALGTPALAKAEAARAADPKGAFLNECTSDDWSRAAAKVESSPFSTDPRWLDLKARWTKACPPGK